MPSFNTSVKTAVLLLTTLLTGLLPADVYCRNLPSASRLALGGGTAYLSGPEAHFVNPANLMIRTHHRNRQLKLGGGVLAATEGFDPTRPMDLVDRMDLLFVPGRTTGNSEALEIVPVVTDAPLKYRLHHHYDVTPFAFTWMNVHSARSLSFRSRGISSSEISHSWFHRDDRPAQESEELNRHIRDRYAVYHEVSLAFASEVTMYNRWYSGLNTLLFGIAPKVLIGGMHWDLTYESHYHAEDGQWRNTKNLQGNTAGPFSSYLSDLMYSSDHAGAFNSNIPPHANLITSGVGFGFDAGVTYIIPIGGDITLSPHIRHPLRRSLRFSFSLTDIGVIYYFENARKVTTAEISRLYNELPDHHERYTGKPADFFQFITADSVENAVMDQLIADPVSFYTRQLPTELNMGTVLQYDLISLMIDASYRLNPNDFEKDKWRGSAGLVLRMFRYFPLMASIQMDPNHNLSFGAGAGMDFGFFSLTGATRLFQDRSDGTEDWLGQAISVMELKIRF